MFKVKFSELPPMHVTFGGQTSFSPSMTEVIEIPVSETYEGDYTITPTESVQTLETEGLLATKNIVINPIPSNWGRVERVGSIIRII